MNSSQTFSSLKSRTYAFPSPEQTSQSNVITLSMVEQVSESFGEDVADCGTAALPNTPCRTFEYYLASHPIDTISSLSIFSLAFLDVELPVTSTFTFLSTQGTGTVIITSTGRFIVEKTKTTDAPSLALSFIDFYLPSKEAEKSPITVKAGKARLDSIRFRGETIKTPVISLSGGAMSGVFSFDYSHVECGSLIDFPSGLAGSLEYADSTISNLHMDEGFMIVTSCRKVLLVTLVFSRIETHGPLLSIQHPSASVELFTVSYLDCTSIFSPSAQIKAMVYVNAPQVSSLQFYSNYATDCNLVISQGDSSSTQNDFTFYEHPVIFYVDIISAPSQVLTLDSIGVRFTQVTPLPDLRPFFIACDDAEVQLNGQVHEIHNLGLEHEGEVYDEASNSIMSLEKLRMYQSNHIFVGDDLIYYATDSLTCGDVEDPCLTITTAMRHLTGSNKCLFVSIIDPAPLNLLLDGVSISPSKLFRLKSILTFYGSMQEEKAVLITRKNVQLETFTVEMVDVNVQTVVLVENGEAKLDSLIFKSQIPATHPLITVNAAKASITSITIDIPSIQKTPYVGKSGSEIDLSFKFSDKALSESFFVSSGDSQLAQLATFSGLILSSISTPSKDIPVISLRGGTYKMNYCVFTGLRMGEGITELVCTADQAAIVCSASTLQLMQCQFSDNNLPALLVISSECTLDRISFHSNPPVSTAFPSFQLNCILKQNSIGTLIGKMGGEFGSSLFISHDESSDLYSRTSTQQELVDEVGAFAEPIIIKTAKDNDTVTITGREFYPCGLSIVLSKMETTTNHGDDVECENLEILSQTEAKCTLPAAVMSDTRNSWGVKMKMDTNLETKAVTIIEALERRTLTAAEASSVVFFVFGGIFLVAVVVLLIICIKTSRSLVFHRMLEEKVQQLLIEQAEMDSNDDSNSHYSESSYSKHRSSSSSRRSHRSHHSSRSRSQPPHRSVTPTATVPRRLSVQPLATQTDQIPNRQQRAPEATHLIAATTHTTIHIARSQDSRDRGAKQRGRLNHITLVEEQAQWRSIGWRIRLLLSLSGRCLRDQMILKMRQRNLHS
ncbi:hypothetical protein BLNAU_19644 [Blattamonas nauphoetae]|uniref:Transmembrane protein n=1 Tax=Blattamonas nauphoetae TaxID=2049346 RepID=A0ABQ9X159_9EUKA|nr:hypothetical protein BLNAU_19644 [Blattamonas nauphoetae]